MYENIISTINFVRELIQSFRKYVVDFTKIIINLLTSV